MPVGCGDLLAVLLFGLTGKEVIVKRSALTTFNNSISREYISTSHALPVLASRVNHNAFGIVWSQPSIILAQTMNCWIVPAGSEATDCSEIIFRKPSNVPVRGASLARVLHSSIPFFFRLTSSPAAGRLLWFLCDGTEHMPVGCGDLFYLFFLSAS